MKPLNSKMLLVLMCIFLFPACGFSAKPNNKVDTVYGFEGNVVLDQLRNTHGVKTELTDEHVTQGTQALKIHVPSFDETKDSYPRVILSTSIFTEPADYSSYTRVSVDVTNTGKGMLKIMFGMSNLPHFDVHGQQQGSKSFMIPSGSTMTLSLDTGGLPRLDPSKIQAMMFRIMTSPNDQVLVVDNIRAEYDSSAGSPMDILINEIHKLKKQYSTIEQKLNLSNLNEHELNQMKKSQRQALEELESVSFICSQIAEGSQKGLYNELRTKVDKLSQGIGKFVLMDKPVFYAWQISPYLNVFPDEMPDFNNEPAKKIAIQLAGGEYNDFVFMITANADTDRKLKISLKSENPDLLKLSHINEVIYLKNRLGERTGDAHFQLNGLLHVPSGQSRQIRIGFDNRSADLRSGIHNFNLHIEDTNSRFEQIIPGTLLVWGFNLPGYDVIANNCYTELYQTPYSKKMNIIVPEMRKAGYNVFYVHPLDLPKVKSYDPASGEIAFDSEHFENMMNSILQYWGKDNRPKFLFSISAFTNTNRPEDLFARVRDDDTPVFPDLQWKYAFRQWVKYFNDKMQQLGYDNSHWMITPADESSEFALRNTDIPIAELIKDVDPKIQTICNSSNTNIFENEALADRYIKAFDIFQPHFGQGSETSLKHIQLRKESGNVIWLYRCHADLNARSANIYDYYRVYLWDAMNFGAKGVGLWSFAENNRRAGQDAWSVPNAGCSLIFQNPTKPDTLFFSRRYEIYRQGRDDYRYVYALRQAAKKTAKDAYIQKAEKLIQAAIEDIISNRYDYFRAQKWRKKIAETIIDFSKS